MNYPLPETTPGIFLEYFDFDAPSEDGTENIIHPYNTIEAKKAALEEGWTLRSYSSNETPGARQDFINRNIRSFPTRILYRDGLELGRDTCVIHSAPGIIAWAEQLLEIQEKSPSREGCDFPAILF
jgi:hypothetical protein